MRARTVKGKPSKAPNRSAQSRWLWLSLAVAATTLLVFVATFFWRVAPVSDDAYQLSSSLFAACNLQDTKRLDAVEARMSSITEARERDRLAGAIEAARQGQWASAMKQARRLMESRTE